ncbi:MAG: hypothetical protein D6731_24175 [Planctomycetota bacterium]|nr:MAG: hypothetical protein D6731_24175 [Planctomycetota bacterium]
MTRPLLAAFLLLSATTLPASAQERTGPGSEAAPDGEGDRGPGPRRGRGPFGDPGRFADNAVEFLAKELDLDTEQRERIHELLSRGVQTMWKRVGERMRAGGAEGEFMDSFRKAMEDVRVELANEISKLLTPAQRREFEVLVDQFDRRAQRFEQTRRAWERPDQLFNPKPLSRRLALDKAERALFLGPEETAAVMPFVERLVDARLALYEGRKVRRQDLLNAIDGGASPEEIRQRVADIRAAEQFQQLEILAASQALRELLTIDQEARFVAMGLLE